VGVTTTLVWGAGKAIRALAIAAALTATTVGTAFAQAPANDPNPGAITFTGGLDVPSVYVFRGIVQESDPKMTLWPYGDIGLALASGEGAVKSVGLNFGVWNSLQTGSSGTDGPSEKLHYEEDFYTTFSLGFDKGITLGTTFTAYTSPNAMFNTVKELSFKVSKSGMIAPYGVIAFELSDNGAADGYYGEGAGKGTYLELGAGPSWSLAGGKATVAIPVKLGMSLSNYYQDLDTGEDNKFGFFDIGALITLPLSGIPGSFGSWNLHGGVDFLAFGDTTKKINSGDGSKVVGLFGIGVTY
jgi:hypothetical protein